MAGDRDLRIRVLLAAIDKASKPIAAVEKASRKGSAALQDARKNLRALERAQGDLDGFRTLKRDIDGTAMALGAARAKVAALARTMGPVEGRTKAMTREFARATKEASDLGDRHAAETRALQAMRTRLDAAGISTRNLASDQRELRTRTAAATAAVEREQEEMDRLGRRQRALGEARGKSARIAAAADRVGGAGVSMIAIGAATAAPMYGAAKAAMTLEEAMAGVKKVTNMAQPDADRMADAFLDMSTRIPMAADQLASIAAAAGAAGIGMDKNGKAMRNQREQLTGFTEDAAKMGIAFDMTAEDAGETMAKWRTAFKLTQPEVQALGDRINGLTNKFGGKAANVTQIVTEIGPLAKVAGLGAQQIAALGASLDANGVKADVAATGIKNMMLALTSGSSATKSQDKQFEALGLTAVGVAKRMQKDAGGAILDVLGRIRKLSAEKQPAVLKELFGSESISAIAPLLTNLDNVRRNLAFVGDSSKYAGSMQGEFLARIATTTGATGLAGNALSAVNVKLGQMLLPTITKAAQWVTKAATSFRAWAAENPRLANVLMMVAGGVAGLLVVLGGLALVASAVMSAVAGFTAVTAALGIAVAGVTWPILAVVAAIAAVIAVGVLLYRNWDTIKAKFAEVWGWLRTSFNAAGGQMMQGLLVALSSSRLVGHVIAMGKAAIGAFKNVLGIHSPSRVFAEIGGHVVGGLTQGLDRRGTDAVDRVTTLGRRMTAAMAIGTAAPAMAIGAGGTGGAGGGMAPVAAAPVYMTVTINVAGGPATDGRSQAREIHDELQRLARNARLSSYADED